MKNVILFLAAFSLGWIASTLLPPPSWLADRAQSLTETVRKRWNKELKEEEGRARQRVQNQNKEYRKRIRAVTEAESRNLEEMIER
ncbi:MAG: hypothetical protein HY401_05685 [Elusimicrobia bacterium]|nr:hypothetical protein [Elusimicrobiota bacterium]